MTNIGTPQHGHSPCCVFMSSAQCVCVTVSSREYLRSNGLSVPEETTFLIPSWGISPLGSYTLCSEVRVRSGVGAKEPCAYCFSAFTGQHNFYVMFGFKRCCHRFYFIWERGHTPVVPILGKQRQNNCVTSV